MQPHDLVGECQPNPGTPDGLVRLIKLLFHVGQVLRRDTAAVVADGDPDVAVLLGGNHADGSALVCIF